MHFQTLFGVVCLVMAAWAQGETEECPQDIQDAMADLEEQCYLDDMNEDDKSPERKAEQLRCVMQQLRELIPLTELLNNCEAIEKDQGKVLCVAVQLIALNCLSTDDDGSSTPPVEN